MIVLLCGISVANDVIYMVLVNRWNGQARALLLGAVSFTCNAILLGGLSALSFQAGLGVIGGLWAVLAAASLWAAQKCWDDWNQRRKRRPAKSKSRVALKLGRLVLIPEARTILGEE